MEIKKYLNTDCDIFEFDCLASTNDTVKDLGLQGAKENTVVIAKTQTAGRGRMGRQFFSPDKSGIYMSILLRPKFSPEDTLLITVAAAVAVSEVLDEICGTDTKIKWVNDIFLGNRKVCGILTESTFLGDGKYFSVLGIGINLYAPKNDFPEDIKEIAGAVYAEPCNTEVKSRLIAAIVDKFNLYYGNLLKKEFLSIYRERSNLIGERIKYIQNGKEIFATVTDIDENARLVVKTDDGQTRRLFAGEVSVAKAFK